MSYGTVRQSKEVAINERIATETEASKRKCPVNAKEDKIHSIKSHH